LEDSVVDLKQENEKLRRLILTKFSKEEITTLVHTMIPASEGLIATLTNKPDQGIAESASSYLQTIRDECSKL
jgi:glyoxylate utilization-related uncharacterized protein